MSWNKISAGLFRWKKWNFWKNIYDIKHYCSRFSFLIKNGYSPVAQWETDIWFIDTMKSILQYYLQHSHSYPILDPEKSDDWNLTAWKDILKDMDSSLDCMREEYYDSEFLSSPTAEKLVDIHKKMDEAKDHFFELFSRYFYDFWD